MSATLVALLLVAVSDRELRRHARKKMGYAAALLAALAIGVAATLFLVGDAITDRFQTVAVDGLERTRLWAFYGKMALDNPWASVLADWTMPPCMRSVLPRTRRRSGTSIRRIILSSPCCWREDGRICC